MAYRSQDQSLAEPDEGAGGLPNRSVPPRTPYEEVIASIWRDLLGQPNIGVFDDFFAVGGHSLLAPKIVARIRKTLGVHITVMDFFSSPTVAGLAAAVAAHTSSSEPRAVSRRPPDAEPVLSFDQQRLWLENQLLPGAAYNVHVRRRVRGPLDIATLEASTRAIIARHEILRTRFPTVAGQPVQVVDAVDRPWHLVREDYRDIADDRDRSDAALRRADEDATTPFDLASGPLFRFLLIALSDTEHLICITSHHIICDAWSIGLFVRELSALYQAGGDVERAGLPMLPVQYRDFAVWQRGQLVGEVLERDVSYWREQLHGAPPTIALPIARRRLPPAGAGAERVRATLSAPDAAALSGLCRAHGVTVFMVLLAGLATVLSRWSGQPDVVIGAPIARRNAAGTDRLIGFFVNTLPLRIDLSGDPTFAELLERVRQSSLNGYAHADAPLDVLVKEVQVPRDPR
ncbi:MAG TPA: condensation domain-containing protein, partial [Micromonosporaceae bacterium]